MLDISHVPPSIGPIETWVLTAAQLAAAFDHGQPGDVIVYAVGDLAYERETGRTAKRARASETGNFALKLYEQGRAELTQKRLGPHKFEYWLTRCR